MEDEREEICFESERQMFCEWKRNALTAIVWIVREELGLSSLKFSDDNWAGILLAAGERLDVLKLTEHDLNNWFEQGGCGVIGEIENNLKAMKPEERGGYVYTLVEPFVSYQTQKYVFLEDRKEEAHLKYWECRGKREKSPAECAFSVYENILEMYGKTLDLTLLKYGINLRWYEEYFGINSLADWRKNEREEFAARCLHLDIREAARMVDEALPHLDAEKPTAGRNCGKSGVAGRLLKGGGDLLAMLHRLIDGRRGKAVALVLYACMELGYMTRPTQGELLAEFDMIGSWESVCKYLRGGAYMLDRKEVEAVKARLSEVVERPENVDSVPKTATRNG